MFDLKISVLFEPKNIITGNILTQKHRELPPCGRAKCPAPSEKFAPSQISPHTYLEMDITNDSLLNNWWLTRGMRGREILYSKRPVLYKIKDASVQFIFKAYLFQQCKPKQWFYKYGSLSLWQHMNLSAITRLFGHRSRPR